MNADNIDIDAMVKKAEILLEEEKALSPALKSMFGMMVVVIKLLANRLDLNSRNSSKPPSSDQNRKKESKNKSDRKPGGQQGHTGTTLKRIEDPDKVQVINIDRRTLPKGRYKRIGFEKRQVFDIDILEQLQIPLSSGSLYLPIIRVARLKVATFAMSI